MQTEAIDLAAIDPDPPATPDVSMVYAIHHALRVDAARFDRTVAALEPGDRADRIPKLRAWFEQYRTQLDSHHRAEDALFFPALEDKVGATAMKLAELDAQHHGLHALIERLEDLLDELAHPDHDFAPAHRDAVDAAGTFLRAVLTHLDLEEHIAFPKFVDVISIEEYDQLQRRLAEQDGPADEFFFLVPWLVEHVPAADRMGVLQHYPEEFRGVYMGYVDWYRDLDSALVGQPDE